jgi:hypothetical protein
MKTELILLAATIAFLLGSMVAKLSGEIIPRYELVAPPRGVPAVRLPRRIWIPEYPPPVARLTLPAPSTSLEPGRFFSHGIPLGAGETLIAIDGKPVRPIRNRPAPMRSLKFNFPPVGQNCGPLG